MIITVPRRMADLLLYAVFVVLVLLAYSVTGSFPSPLLPGYPGSAMFPRLVLIAMGIIAAFGLIRTLIRPMPGPDVVLQVGGYLGIVASLAAFALLLTFVGMEVAVFAFIGGGVFVRNRRVLPAVVSGVVAVAVVYGLFVQALSVHLPMAVLPRYISTVF